MKQKENKNDNWKQDVRDAFKYFINPAREGIGLVAKKNPVIYLRGGEEK